jgi:hypothetical protein
LSARPWFDALVAHPILSTVEIPLPCSKILPIVDEMPKHKTISMTQLAKQAERIAMDIESSGATYTVKRPDHRAVIVVDAE